MRFIAFLDEQQRPALGLRVDADMIFDVAALVAACSEAMRLEVGDLVITGTPAGVGLARKPPVWMRAGDLCEIEIERIGILANRIVDEI